MSFKITDPDLTKKQLALVKRRMLPREHWEEWVGRKVYKGGKGSSLPSKFKDGKRINTVKGVVLHPIISELHGHDTWAFTFEEHDTFVACHCVKEFDPNSQKTSNWIRSELFFLREAARKRIEMSC